MLLHEYLIFTYSTVEVHLCSFQIEVITNSCNYHYVTCLLLNIHMCIYVCVCVCVCVYIYIYIYMYTVSNFIFLGSKITADGDCNHEIKRCLLLGRKVMTNLDSILKSRDITLPTKVHLVMAMVLPVVMYGCESWTVKKAERQRIDAFELWCWRRLLRVPWTTRRPNQSILKEVSPGVLWKDWC